MKKRYLLLFIILLLLLTTGCNRTPKENNDAENNLPPEPEEEVVKESFFVGDRYKDILLDNNSGDSEKLSDYLGKPILVNFWVSWSPGSENINDTLKEYYADIKDSMHVISINVTAIENNNLEYIIKYIESERYPFPVYYDLDGQISSDYLVRSFPTGYIIDKQGFIEKIFIGDVDEELFLLEIEKAISGRKE
ncbi:MAG: TlpA disulfide reductase family protein [Peptostreptococcales bacterium]